jgi:two-component system, OmpR family, phosphate regulon response regulator OmpR
VSTLTHILVVDDEPGIRELIQTYLGKEGYRVSAAENGEALRRVMAEETVDLVILDLGLPEEDGLSLARYLREHYDVAVIIVTGKGETVDRIVGREIGADDYLAKPFDLRELLARVRSVLRRVDAEPEPAAAPPRQGVRFGRCTLDLGSRRLEDADGAEIPLTAMEYDLLAVFARHPRQVLSRERLAELAHNRPLAPGDRSVDIRITRLRQKLEPDAANPTVLRTVRGEGYAYEPEG